MNECSKKLMGGNALRLSGKICQVIVNYAHTLKIILGVCLPSSIVMRFWMGKGIELCRCCLYSWT